MRVALYKNHHNLPFWHRPQNPYTLFDPTVIKDWICQGQDGDFPAENHSLIHVLNGLLSLEIPDVMANVSFNIDTEHQVVKCPHRCWVQITTESNESDNNGIPIVFKGDEIQVTHLWGGDNGTYTPYGFLKDERDEHLTPQFWTEFFLNKLQETKEVSCKEAQEVINEAEETLRQYKLIPSPLTA